MSAPPLRMLIGGGIRRLDKMSKWPLFLVSVANAAVLDNIRAISLYTERCFLSRLYLFVAFVSALAIEKQGAKHYADLF